MECYSAIKMNKLLTYTTIWINFENTMLSERNRILYDSIYSKYPESKLVVVIGWGAGRDGKRLLNWVSGFPLG